MAQLDLSPYELLTTTRAVRKRLDFDRQVDMNVVQECVEIAMQAPTASNEQSWHFMVVTDQTLRSQIAGYYKQAWESYSGSTAFSAYKTHSDDPNMKPVQDRMVSSVGYLAENLEKVPVFVIPCVNGRFENLDPSYAVMTQASKYGSIIPAAWSFMLAARLNGLGTTWTTLHLFYEKEIAGLLGIPFDETTQVALIPVAHTIGTKFKPGPRREIDRVLHVNRW